MPLTKQLLRALFLEARRAGTILPGALRQVPKVGQVGVHLDEFAHLGVGKAEVADRLVEADAQRDRRRVAHRVAISATTSRAKRERFSRLPPYSSVRWLVARDRKCWKMPKPCAP
jgi:hypothetical protein